MEQHGAAVHAALPCLAGAPVLDDCSTTVMIAPPRVAAPSPGGWTCAGWRKLACLCRQRCRRCVSEVQAVLQQPVYHICQLLLQLC